MEVTLARVVREGHSEEVICELTRSQLMQGLGGHSKESALLFYSSAKGRHWRA